jgi:hypothetical protein
MKVFYPGSMTGHHVIGRRSVNLVPGENNIPEYDLAMALIAQKIVQPVEDDYAVEVATATEPPAGAKEEDPDEVGKKNQSDQEEVGGQETD